MENVLRRPISLILLGLVFLCGTTDLFSPSSFGDEDHQKTGISSTEARQSLWGASVPINHSDWADSTDENAYVTVHQPDPSSGDKPKNGLAVIICPGGGYGGLVVGPEGHSIADWLNLHGITGVVLEYRLPKQRHAVPLLDAQRAVRFVRARSKQLGIDPNSIGVMGFSAGGHLASTIATHFDSGNMTADDPIEQKSSRPDFAVLVYPVITMYQSTHRGSKRNLLGDNPTPALVERYSNEKQVARNTPPMFLAHAVDDHPVPIENSRLLYDALRHQGVAARLLELESGGHGLNGYRGPMWDKWQQESVTWMLGLLN